jgi:hypothetical protein
MLVRLLIAGFLVAHAAIHLAFVTPAPPATASGPAWPFSTDQSWLVARLGWSPEAVQGLAYALVAGTIVAFAAGALAAIGVLPASIWAPSVAIGAVISLVTLVAFFHPWLVLGIAIDAGLLWAAVIAGWAPAAPALEG